jgi:hypothetical protein
MADLNKFQNTSLSNLAKIWNTSVSNLNKVMGLTISSISGTITADTPVVFESANTEYTSVCMLDSTHAIVVYRDLGNSNYGTACCLTLSGTTISAATPVVFTSTNVAYCSVCRMDSTHAIVAFTDGFTITNYGKACCLTLSGTTITAGAIATFASASTLEISICTMDSTHAIVVYRDAGNTNYGTACCLTLSGTTITSATEVVFASATTTFPSICSLDSSNAIVTYRDNGNSNYGTACCLTLSGTTITSYTEVVFESASTSNTRVCAMDSTHAIVVYLDVGNNSYGTACCLTLSGTTITAGTPVAYTNATLTFVDICSMSSVYAIATHFYSVAANGKALCLTLNGTSITYGSEVIFESGRPNYLSSIKMDLTNAISVYKDTDNSNYGTSCCLTLS